MAKRPKIIANDDDDAELGDNPTPEERGRLIVKRLEQFIRDGRSDEGGMSFDRWQEMAKDEVINAIRDAERHWQRDQRFVDRAFTVGAAALVTVGFWGTAVAVQQAPDRQIAGVILVGAGAVLLVVLAAWAIRRAEKYYQKSRRRDRFQRIQSFEANLKALQKSLDQRVADLADALEEMEEADRVTQMSERLKARGIDWE